MREGIRGLCIKRVAVDQVDFDDRLAVRVMRVNLNDSPGDLVSVEGKRDKNAFDRLPAVKNHRRVNSLDDKGAAFMAGQMNDHVLNSLLLVFPRTVESASRSARPCDVRATDSPAASPLSRSNRGGGFVGYVSRPYAFLCR